MSKDVITLGESLVAFIPDTHTKLRYVHQFGKVVVGAESNVAVGLAKLGYSTGWVSKVGNDEFGQFMIRELKAEGVDTSSVIISDEGPTAIMFKQFSNALDTSVFYYRTGSAASTMHKDSIDWEYMKETRIIHISGITSAISESCRDLVEAVFAFAKQEHLLVSFDPNIRLKLMTEEKARNVLAPLLFRADIVLLGEDEGRVLLGTENPEEIAKILLENGCSYLGVKQGSHGAYVADSTDGFFIDPYPVKVVDTIGAGDAFNTGFLAGLLDNQPIEKCGRMGALLGALAVSSHGDVEGLPDGKTFHQLMDNKKEIHR
ncbi:sugar kinase [Sphaerochaeta sp. S2]|uniref:sugar kinase n=1 Tax=Sphaerochaeta sp. S2 TaxID=2798868 RepID=UPI0018E9F573|nr:sugar kinase [Sphaerochaeta sp. S2]MCK9347615.1 sugar kinase [Sphaerochaeta sp.]MDD4302599.1 sugar kinase [Sphaerochaeta sp.]